MNMLNNNLLLKVEMGGKTIFVPIQDAAQYAAIEGAVVTVVDAETKLVAENVETVRQGEDLVVVVDGEQVAMLDGFYTDGSNLTLVTAEGSVVSNEAVWMLSTSGEEEAVAGFPGGSAGIAMAGLGGFAIGGAGKSETDSGNGGGPEDRGAVVITISLDTEVSSATYGQWVTDSSDDSMMIDAAKSYDIVFRLPDIATASAMNEASDLQVDGVMGGEGLIAGAWNLGSDDKVIWMFPDAAMDYDYAYFSHSEYYRTYQTTLRAGGSITNYGGNDTGYNWVSLYYTANVDSVTGFDFFASWRETGVSAPGTLHTVTVQLFTTLVTPVGDELPRQNGVFNTEHHFYAA